MIFVGFTSKLGRVDVESIEKFKENNDVEKVYVFCREDPSDAVKNLARDYEIVKTKNPHADAKKLVKDLKKSGKRVLMVDLNDFGERAIRDVC